MTGTGRPTRRLFLWFAATTIPAALALVWLAWFVARQDREAAARRQSTEREQAAEVGLAALARTLAEFERLLSTATALPESARTSSAPILRLAFDTRGVIDHSGFTLPFYPAVSRPSIALPDELLLADVLEFQQRNSSRALELLRALAQDARPEIRAESWLRVARNHRVLDRHGDALAAYEKLIGLGDATVQGAPAGLMGHIGRALVFVAAQRERELRDEASRLVEAVQRGEWRLTRTQLEFSLAQAAGWLARPAADLSPAPGDRQPFADIVDDVSAAVLSGRAPAARQALTAHGQPVLALSQAARSRTTVLLVSTSAFSKAWAANLPDGLSLEHFALLDDRDVVILGGATGGAAYHTRKSQSVTGLPWTLAVAGPSTPGDRTLSTTARLMLAGIGVMGLVVFASGLVVMRAMSREMRIAQLQSDFVAAVSHEFRTPLTTIRQLSELLVKARVSSPERRQQFYDAILRESGRLQRLVEGLLDFGRMESGRMTFREEPVDVAGLVREVAEHVGREAPAGYRFEVGEAPALPSVRGDREAIGHAIRNLLDNAVKYSPDHKLVRVDLEARSGGVAIQVRDRGLGIPASEQQEIFQKFVRGALSTSRQIAGSGVGLAMTRHIVEAHRGTISVESSPGHGSTFTITLPIEPTAHS